MIFRISHKLNAKIKAGALATLPLHENPFADWSAHLFRVGRRQYILVSNTTSLYSTVLAGKGITDESDFIQHALSSIRQLLEAQGQQAVYERLIAPTSATVRFTKALNRSLTGSLNDMGKQAVYYLAAGDLSVLEISDRLNDTPMSALEQGGSRYGFPRNVFAEMVSSARS